MDSSEFLIDLSTPKPASRLDRAVKLHGDFTPSLTKALSNTFLKAAANQKSLASSARTLFPSVKSEQDILSKPIIEEEEDDEGEEREVKEELNEVDMEMENEEEKKEGLEENDPLPSSFKLNNTKSLLKNAINNSIACQQPGGLTIKAPNNNMMDYLLSTPEHHAPIADISKPVPSSVISKSTTTLQQLETAPSLKRPPSTPNTPRILSKFPQRRRVLHENSDEYDTMSANMLLNSPIRNFETPAKYVPAEMARVVADANLWGVIDFEVPQSDDDDQETDYLPKSDEENEQNQVQTPESVLKVRRRVRHNMSTGGKRKPMHPLSQRTFDNIDPFEAEYTSEKDSSFQEFDDTDEESLSAQNVQISEKDLTSDQQSIAIKKLELEKNYDAWMYQQDIHQWQEIVMFVELEKRFGIV